MSTLGQKISNACKILDSEKQGIKSYKEKALMIESLWKDFNVLLKTLIMSYVNFGRKHTDESETLLSYRNSFAKSISLSKILFIIGSYSSHIGNFYSTQSHDLSHSLKSKSSAFSLEIKFFLENIKEKSFKTLENLSKILSELKSEHIKLEKSRREHDEVKILLLNLESNTVCNDKKLEIGLKNSQFKLSSQVLAFEESILALIELFYRNIRDLKDQSKHLHESLIVLENKCLENIQNIVDDIKRLAFTLSEYRKNTSENMKSALLIVPIDESVDTSFCRDQIIEISDKKLEVLKYLKDYMTIIADVEDFISFSYTKAKKASFLNQNATDLVSNTSAILEELEDIFTMHNLYAEKCRENVLKPLESVFRMHSSLNSSIKISIKKILISYKKAEEFLMRSPTKESSKSSGFKTSEICEINEVLNDYILREKKLLSSTRAIFLTLHDQSLEFYNTLQDLQTKIVNSSKTIRHTYTLRSLSIDFSNDNYYYDETISILKDKSRNNFIINSDESFSSDDEEFNRRFSIEIKEPVISTYICAFSDGILLHGKMYITANYLCFYSHFNSSTILGGVTSLTIDLSHIVLLEKKYNAFIFDNSIEITTKERKYFFTSFVSRDEAYTILAKLLMLKERKSFLIKHHVDFIIEERKGRLCLGRMIKDKKDIQSRMFPDNYFFEEVFVPELHTEIPIYKIYQLFFSDNSYDFHYNYLTEAGDIDIDIGKWSVPPPDFYIEKSSGDVWNNIATRTVVSNHKLKERLPLMSTHALLKENQTIYFVSEEKFVIEGEFEVHAPFGDCFKSYMRWVISGRDNAIIQARYGCVFSKNTIFKGKIIKEGAKETVSTLNGIWWRLAEREIKKDQGIFKEEEETQPQVIEKPKAKLEITVGLYGIIALLVLIIAKLWQKVSLLEQELARFQ
ncbi:hypothetical protein SteCoe_16119 [Stentor coeruleus]|uniref:VASt domain-containing protein n=1 Tax=Stentor coeruleus TaxID=5963 RepID=A0A1R2C216_9CILI|nr:hypothetical protein SteCoe_16119 [Stentor coeruleus]